MKNVLAVIGGGCLLLILLSGGCFYLIYRGVSGAKDADPVINRFLTSVANAQDADAYAQLGASAKSRETEAEFTARTKALRESVGTFGLADITQDQVNVNSVNGTTRLTNGYLVKGSKSTRPITMHLTRSGSAWTIDQFDTTPAPPSP